MLCLMMLWFIKAKSYEAESYETEFQKGFDLP
jgi:hypothetical protein